MTTVRAGTVSALLTVVGGLSDDGTCTDSLYSDKPRPPRAVISWLRAAPPPQWPQNLSAWALRLPCASVGGSEQAVSSTSRLREPTLCIRSCLLLDSEASAELGEAEISDDAEYIGTSTGSHG